LRAIILVWLVLLAAAPAEAQRAAEPPGLAAFAQSVGLRDVPAFVETIQTLRRDQRLPSRYVSKQAARAHGWHGGGLCAAWPGHAIGGDVFHNFSGGLPPAPGRVFREADLDPTCGSRGPKRLIFSNDGLIFVTVDHYNTFASVP
jgi:hypothetical protein